MKKKSFFAVLCLFTVVEFFHGVNAYASPIKIEKLDNGLTIVVAPVLENRAKGHSAVSLFIASGSDNDPIGAEGTAHAVEHMLFKRTKNFHGNELASLYLNTGDVHGNAETGTKHTVYTLYSNDEKTSLNETLKILSDFLSHGDMRDSDFQNVRSVILNENTTRGAEKENGQWFDYLVDYLRGETRASIKNISIENVINYYQSYYAPKNATVIIGTSQDLNRTMEVARNIFSDAKNKETAMTSVVSFPIKNIVNMPFKFPNKKEDNSITLYFGAEGEYSFEQRMTAMEILDAALYVYKNKQDVAFEDAYFLDATVGQKPVLTMIVNPKSIGGKIQWKQALIDAVSAIGYTLNLDMTQNQFDTLKMVT